MNSHSVQHGKKIGATLGLSMLIGWAALWAQDVEVARSAPGERLPFSQLPQVEFEARVQKMTDLVVDFFPVGAMTDALIQSDPRWPVPAKAANQPTSEQLACLRDGLSSDGIRRKMLSQVRDYAAADIARFEAAYKLLDTGSTDLMKEAFIGAMRGDAAANRANPMAKFSPKQAISMMTLMLEPRYTSLRELIGLPQDMSSSIGQNPENAAAMSAKVSDSMKKRMTSLVGNLVIACGVRPATAAVARSPVPGVELVGDNLVANFGHSCASVSEASPATSKTHAPRPDPKSPFAAPYYPQSAKQLGLEGTVYVSALITRTGRIGEARLQKSSGNRELDESAVRGSESWKLLPGTVDGATACMWVTIPVVFKIAPTSPASTEVPSL
jgi:TonB family protein